MRYLERLAALVLLVLWMPVLLVLAVLIKLNSSGPAIYKEIRFGKGEKEFVIYKLRTMFIGAHSGGVFDAKDPRITKVGHWLRRSRIDEVPQLWNIVKGEMAFVGPRPHNLSSDARHRRNFGRRYTNRYQLKPGISGFTQVMWNRGDNNTDVWLPAMNSSAFTKAPALSLGFSGRVSPAYFRAKPFSRSFIWWGVSNLWNSPLLYLTHAFLEEKDSIF